MAWQTENNIDLGTFSTMRIGGVGKCLLSIQNPETQLLEIFDTVIKKEDSYHVVGEGSNSIFAGDFPDTYFLQLDNKNIVMLNETDESVTLRVGGGCSWDALVAYAVEHNLQGIEMLSAIPGTVGAAPVQNIGAYGGEFADVCQSVSAFGAIEKEYKTFSRDDCRFEYRNSIFKQNPGRYIIYTTDIVLLKKKEVSIPDYPGVAAYLKEKDITEPRLEDIRNAITDIRWGKLPKPSELPNCGSFFKNALIPQSQADALLLQFPNMKVFPDDNGMVKIPTGWLIESQNLKGYRVGDMGIYEKHALIIVNHGKGTVAELEALIKHIQETIFQAFTIRIEPEVNIISPENLKN